jgi:hypothetical protein
MSNQGSSNHGGELERYLQGGSGLSKLYKDTATEQPPPELDAAILARARNEAIRPPRRGLGPFTRSWFIPASVAAVLVLAVGLITFMYEQGEAPFAPEALPPMEKKAPAAQIEEMDRLLRDAPAQDEEGALRETTPAQEPSPTGKAPQEATGAASTAPAAPPASRAGPSRLEEQELKQERFEAPNNAGRADQRVPAAKSAAETLSPEAWLRYIAELRKQGKPNEAEASLEEFKKRYPDYPIETILK